MKVEVDEIASISLEPGEVLLIQLTPGTPPELFENIRSHLLPKFPEEWRDRVILTCGVTFTKAHTA